MNVSNGCHSAKTIGQFSIAHAFAMAWHQWFQHDWGSATFLVILTWMSPTAVTRVIQARVQESRNESHFFGLPEAETLKWTDSGLLNSPKTKTINGIMLVVFPFPFVQVSLWRCNLETTDWIVVPGAWVPNPPNADGCTPVAFWGLGFGKLKALLRKPRHQHLLVGDPLNSVG